MGKVDSINRTLNVSCRERQNLSPYLEQIWQLYFSDIPRANEVLIKYCYPWRSRLGLIRLSLDQCVSFIGINTLLQSPLIPDYVLLVTIAHELTHYAHGFGSPLPRACLHPHADRVVDRELERRDLGCSCVVAMNGLPNIGIHFMLTVSILSRL